MSETQFSNSSTRPPEFPSTRHMLMSGSARLVMRVAETAPLTPKDRRDLEELAEWLERNDVGPGSKDLDEEIEAAVTDAESFFECDGQCGAAIKAEKELEATHDAIRQILPE